MTDTRVKTRYLRDPDNYDRALTLVTHYETGSDEVSYAYTINHPDEWKIDGEGDGWQKG
jgi:hypothetical protein